MKFDIPGYVTVDLQHAVLDFNGTLAKDGCLIEGVRDKICQIAEVVNVHVLTADTHSCCHKELEGLPCTVHVVGPGKEDEAKLMFVQDLGAGHCFVVGNGFNDRMMIASARVGVVVMQEECASAKAMAVADLVAPSIGAALDLLLKPTRIIAGLRG